MLPLEAGRLRLLCVNFRHVGLPLVIQAGSCRRLGHEDVVFLDQHNSALLMLRLLESCHLSQVTLSPSVDRSVLDHRLLLHEAAQEQVVRSGSPLALFHRSALD